MSERDELEREFRRTWADAAPWAAYQGSVTSAASIPDRFYDRLESIARRIAEIDAHPPDGALPVEQKAPE